MSAITRELLTRLELGLQTLSVLFRAPPAEDTGGSRQEAARIS
jgi:hypothetical protein